MTVKELNKIKNGFWLLLMAHPEIRKAVDISGRAVVYDIRDYRHHRIMVVDLESQVNDKTIAEMGIDPQKAEIKKLFTVGKHHNISF